MLDERWKNEVRKDGEMTELCRNVG
jgi:hypothetical protein